MYGNTRARAAQRNTSIGRPLTSRWCSAMQSESNGASLSNAPLLNTQSVIENQRNQDKLVVSHRRLTGDNKASQFSASFKRLQRLVVLDGDAAFKKQ